MEVQFAPELQVKIDQWAVETGRAPDKFIKDAVSTYIGELEETREAVNLVKDGQDNQNSDGRKSCDFCTWVVSEPRSLQLEWAGSLREPELQCHCRQHLHRLGIQHRRPISPLAHAVQRSLSEAGIDLVGIDYLGIEGNAIF